MRMTARLLAVLLAAFAGMAQADVRIKDIATFEARGYRWNDVRYVNCDDLAAVPDGVPIPPDAGPPPQP